MLHTIVLTYIAFVEYYILIVEFSSLHISNTYGGMCGTFDERNFNK